MRCDGSNQVNHRNQSSQVELHHRNHLIHKKSAASFNEIQISRYTNISKPPLSKTPISSSVGSKSIIIHERMVSESSSDSVPSIGFSKVMSSCNSVPVHDHELARATTEHEPDQFRAQRFAAQGSPHCMRMELQDSAIKDSKVDSVVDKLNAHLKKMERNDMSNLTSANQEIIFAPKSLHSYGLSYGVESLKGIEKARQEMIWEIEAQERLAQDKSDSSIQEPVKDENPKAWKRWQDAKKLLAKVKERERQLMGADRNDVILGLDQDSNVTVQNSLEAEINSVYSKGNFSGIFNMTFENLAAGLLELVRRRSGLNSSSELQQDEPDEGDDSESSFGDHSALSKLSFSSDVVVERNREEGVTRWVDARDRVSKCPTPSWKRVGRHKRMSRGEQDLNMQHSLDVINSVQNLFSAPDACTIESDVGPDRSDSTLPIPLACWASSAAPNSHLIALADSISPGLRNPKSESIVAECTPTSTILQGNQTCCPLLDDEGMVQTPTQVTCSSNLQPSY